MQTRTKEEEVHSSHGLLTLMTPELCQTFDTAGNYDYGSQDFAQPSQPEIVSDGSMVRFDPEQMEQGTPYPFRLSGSWFVAVKRQEGHLDFLFVQ